MSKPEDEEPMMEEEEPEVEEGEEELEGEGGEGEEGEKPEDEGEGEEEGKGAEEGEGEEDPADEFSDERPKASPSVRKSKSAARGFRNSWVDIKPGLTWDERESKERKAYGKKWKMNTSLKLPSPAEMRIAAARDTYEAPQTGRRARRGGSEILGWTSRQVSLGMSGRVRTAKHTGRSGR